MKIVFFGSDNFSINAAEVIRQHIVAIFTIGDRNDNRGFKKKPEIVKWAIENNINYYQFDDLKSDKFKEILNNISFDIFVIASFGKKIPKNIINIPKYGGLNIHPSLLPKYRGMAPVTRALLNGDKKTGVTIHKLAPKIDAGDIIIKEEIEISPLDNDLTLKIKLAKKGGKLINQIINNIKTNNIPTYFPQDNTQATYAKAIIKEDRLINWNNSAEKIYNQIRALYPKPLAFSFFKEKRIDFLEIEIIDNNFIDSNILPGTIIKKKPLEIATGKGIITLKRVKPESKKEITGIDFINGFRIKINDKFLNNFKKSW